MIQLEGRGLAPEYLDNAEVHELRDKVGRFFAKSEKSRRQERPDFPLFPKPVFTKLMADLFRLSHGKCAYCETPLPAGQPSLDRFRPKAGAVGVDGVFSTEHYWWLAYEWENLYPACLKCNKFKGPKFPIAGLRAHPGTTGPILAQERPLLLDPFADDPSPHLDFQDDGTVEGRTREGQMSIATFELNRSDLIVARRRRSRGVMRILASRDFQKTVSDRQDFRQKLLDGKLERVTPLVRGLAQAVHPAAPWCAAARAALDRWSLGKARMAKGGRQRKSLAETVRGQRIIRQAESLRSHLVTRVEIRNFRGIQNLNVTMDVERGGGAPWTAFLGENGFGKSSILQAIALTLLDEDRGLQPLARPKAVLRKGEARGWVKVWFDETPEPRQMHFSRGARRFRRSGPGFPLTVLGYGATRLLPHRRTKTLRRHIRIDSMFDPFQPLLDASGWLGRLDSVSFDYVARALKDVLELPGSARLRRLRSRTSPAARLKLFGAELSLDELSDGYQSVLGLTCDIIAGLHAESSGALEAAEGFVAIDELGAHLHPRWRMRVVENLRKAFPRVQFVVSTHDPLCLRGLQDGEAVVLRRTARGRIFPVPDLPPIKGLRVDQLLTSEYFGLDSTMDPSVERAFRELYRLLAKRTPTNRQRARIDQLRQELAPHRLPGETRRERRLLEIIDKELAQVEQEPDLQQREAIRRSSEQLAADLNLASARP